MIKNLIYKIPDYIYIGICRSFLPLSTLWLIFFLTKTESTVEISTVSFVFAAAQTLSQLDGGAPSYVMSSSRNGDWRMLRSGINHYAITGFKWLTLMALMAFGLNSIFQISSFILILSGCLLAVSISAYNISVSTFIKERLWGAMILYVASMGTLQILLLAYLYFFKIKYSDLYLALYSLPLILATALFYLSKEKTGTSVERGHAGQLQVSQLASSLVSNKEYLLLHAFSMHQEAALYSILGRLIFMPMQVTSIYISKIWSNLDGKARTSKAHLIQSGVTSMVISAALTFPVAIYFALEGVDLILLGTLTALNVLNAFSGVTSAFSSTNPKSIPSVMWFLISTCALFAASCLLYDIGDWRLSIACTVLYFGWFSRKLILNISWQTK